MTNKNNTVLYVGVTNNLLRRVYEHEQGLIEGFTKKYNCNKLVWFQQTSRIDSAIKEEKRMKSGKENSRKIQLMK